MAINDHIARLGWPPCAKEAPVMAENDSSALDIVLTLIEPLGIPLAAYCNHSGCNRNDVLGVIDPCRCSKPIRPNGRIMKRANLLAFVKLARAAGTGLSSSAATPMRAILGASSTTTTTIVSSCTSLVSTDAISLCGLSMNGQPAVPPSRQRWTGSSKICFASRRCGRSGDGRAKASRSRCQKML